MWNRRNKLGALTEKDFRQQVIDLAHLLGWRCYFTWNSIHSPAGFPDLVMLRRGRQVVAELKTSRRLPTAAQQAWLEEFRAAGVETFVWRPEDLEEIASVLGPQRKKVLTEKISRATHCNNDSGRTEKDTGTTRLDSAENGRCGWSHSEYDRALRDEQGTDGANPRTRGAVDPDRRGASER
jgi:hypothetical protein